MKLTKLDLLAVTTTGTYDQTKTVLRGNVHAKNISGLTCLGPALNKWLDVYTDSNITPLAINISEYGRVFVSSSEVSTTIQIGMYDFNFITGAATYVGKITIHAADTAATSHVIRGFKIFDNAGTTGWRVLISTTGSVAVNGGTYLVNKVDKADFTFVGTDFPFATSSDAKATYFLQDPANIGVNQLNIQTAGVVLDVPNTKLYVHNGVAATHQYYVYDVGTAPTWVPNTVNVSVATPGVVSDAGHVFNNNDQVVFTSGPLPTGLVVGTTYFVRSAVAGVSYQLSATTGGASINTTGSPATGVTIGRAHGITGSNFVHKTGNLPALSGTLLLVDSEDYAIPGHTANIGVPCSSFHTTTTMYLGKLSELTSGATTWPSLVFSNNNATSDTIAQSSRAATWSNVLDRAVLNTSGSLRLILKQVVNSFADRVFGRTNISAYEGTSPQVVYVGANTETSIVGMDMESGWLFLASNASGQRGLLAADMRSDSLFGYSYIITKVITLKNANLKTLSRWRGLDNQTDGLLISYRLSGFGSETGGWIQTVAFSDLSAIAVNGGIQFKIEFDTFTKEAKGLHAQINELFVGWEGNDELSENWEFSDDFSDNISPSRCAFRLKSAYSTVVPTLYFRAYDLSDALLVNNNSVTNAAKFEYSTDNGTSWLPLGTIPNTIGTLVRYTFTSPPGVDIRPGLKES